MDSLWPVVNTVAMFIMAFAAAYFFLALGMGVAQVRRQSVSLGFQADVPYGRPFDPLPGVVATDTYTTFFLVACLNEERVIDATVRGLIDPQGRDAIVVVDDGSDDATGAVALAAGGEAVHVVRRELPHARQGKGAALNAGFAHILAEVDRRQLDPTTVVVCVMDADGRLSNGALAEVLPLFDDPAVGGVQLPVRIRNRSTNFLLRFQDYQFWTQSALTQFGRMPTDTVSLGGNGQFTRLSALLEVGQTPWSGALTEDLDVTISLAIRGWKTTSSPRAAVDQQGLESFSPLLRQRTRWYQGHMMAIRRLPEVLRSDRVSNKSAIEISLYLAVPWLLDLPWSVLYHLILLEIALSDGVRSFMGAGYVGSLIVLSVWYVLGFWPALITGYLARARDPHLSRWEAFKMGHSFLITNYLSYICVWRALFRMARGEHGWTKTARVVEADAPPTPAPVTVP